LEIFDLRVGRDRPLGSIEPFLVLFGFEADMQSTHVLTSTYISTAEPIFEKLPSKRTTAVLSHPAKNVKMDRHLQNFVAKTGRGS
jgi:hypothetical protein